MVFGFVGRCAYWVSIVKCLNIDDIILDISLTLINQDCASHLGIAREIMPYKHTKIKSVISDVDFLKLMLVVKI